MSQLLPGLTAWLVTEHRELETRHGLASKPGFVAVLWADHFECPAISCIQLEAPQEEVFFSA